MNVLNKVIYYILIVPISILPIWFLHGISSFMYVVIYFVFGYRKKVIRGNLERSFPKFSNKQIRKIERKFYQHFCDIIIESLKNFSISKKSTKKRFVIENPEVVDRFAKEGRDVIIAGGHYNAWELFALAMPLYHQHQGVGIYKPLSNQFFDMKLRLSREQFGLKLISMKESARYFANPDESNRRAFILGGDQSPSNPKNAYWMNFLNQDTGVLFGTEKYAKEHNLPVIFGMASKVKRGHYSLTYKVLFENPQEAPYGKITEAHTQALEKQIVENPQYWLWSHRRWKHKRPSDLKQYE
ncbi:lysophospholipid acyltransferase family protein [Flavobacteriales bacterium]|nr:lysophospholipid acyltransferase family protein [Flavobacteriales bacterium]